MACYSRKDHVSGQDRLYAWHPTNINFRWPRWCHYDECTVDIRGMRVRHLAYSKREEQLLRQRVCKLNPTPAMWTVLERSGVITISDFLHIRKFDCGGRHGPVVRGLDARLLLHYHTFRFSVRRVWAMSQIITATGGKMWDIHNVIYHLAVFGSLHSRMAEATSTERRARAESWIKLITGVAADAKACGLLRFQSVGEVEAMGPVSSKKKGA